MTDFYLQRVCLAESSELLIERMAADGEGCGASVGAVMGIADDVALPQEVSHFFNGEPLSGFDGSAAGHGMEHVIEQITA